MPVVTELPKGLEEHAFQRNSPKKQLGWKTPPDQLILARSPKARSQEDRATAEITFPSKVSKTYRVFSNGNLEQFICHVRLMESILKDLKILELITVAKAEMKEKQDELDLLLSRLARARSTTPSSHRRFATEDSPDSTENSRANENVPQVK